MKFNSASGRRVASTPWNAVASPCGSPAKLNELTDLPNNTQNNTQILLFTKRLEHVWVCDKWNMCGCVSRETIDREIFAATWGRETFTQKSYSVRKIRKLRKTYFGKLLPLHPSRTNSTNLARENTHTQKTHVHITTTLSHTPRIHMQSQTRWRTERQQGVNKDSSSSAHLSQNHIEIDGWQRPSCSSAKFGEKKRKKQKYNEK